ncbi:class I SAM-dependent methyltransferase [Primorskyibacter marinus]|uniref:class I SAM-dependent methyltransferase n=1 Tax=Primorskyibacter marinus TaxID=1977320 RepID=UPI000E30175A|nr:class I SAM-dependent methyltransferase [Primorskyibacter marinus]
MTVTNEAEKQARVDALLVQGKNVYQPLYNYPHKPAIGPLRPCLDRCRAVEAAMRDNIEGRKLWDAGCSLGYNTLYFVDRGMIGHGTDIDPRNVSLCQEIQRYTPGSATFAQEELSAETCAQIAPGDFDYAFFFSILHHIVQNKGLKHVQGMMQMLTERIPVLFVELALKSEIPPPGYTWDTYLPDEELAIFETCGALDIQLIGHFVTHVGPLPRPLYRVSRKNGGGTS